MKRSDEKNYADAIDYFGISASEVMHEIKTQYKAIDYFNSLDDPQFVSPTWLTERVMTTLHKKCLKLRGKKS